MAKANDESHSDTDCFTKIGDGASPFDSPSTEKKFNKSKRFWAITAILSVTGILGALENTVVTTALPFITQHLGLGNNYIWVTNVFFLTGAAVQPFFGQLANIFERRSVTMTAVFFFTPDSGICAGATNDAMLIAGQAVQRIGASSINITIDAITSDLVPVRYKEMSLLQKLKRIGYGGNFILLGATVAILYALTYGSTKYLWSSPNVVVPFTIGLAGLGFFMWFETTSWAKELVVPPRLFANRISCVIFGITFLNLALLYWVLLLLPVYFQTVLGSSAARWGTDTPLDSNRYPRGYRSGTSLGEIQEYLGASLFPLLFPTTAFRSWTALSPIPRHAPSLRSRRVAYERAQAERIQSFPSPTREQIISVYSGSLEQMWQISIVFSGLSFLLVFPEKQVKLRTTLETE